ncbi:MAG: NAD-dependent epimerase/dehydratase family protein [Verrucomicrobiota bacterium]
MKNEFYNGKKVLVTGGAGFVGTYFVKRLLEAGAQVRVTVHKRPMIIEDARIEKIEADLTREEDCLRATTGMQYVIHAAGAVSAAGVTASGPMPAIVTNLVLTSRVLEGCWASGVERCLIFGSSTGYPPADHPIKEEEMWTGETYPAYFGYGWMRRYLERLGEFVSQKSKTKIAIARPTAIYGPHDNFDPKASHVIPALIRKAVEKMNPYEVWGTGDEVRDFLHVDDLARGCLMMLENYCDGKPMNLGYGKAFTIKEMIQIILDAAGYSDAKLFFNKDKPGTIPFRMVDSTKAKEILGFEPQIRLENGLRDTVKWYLEMQQ